MLEEYRICKNVYKDGKVKYELHKGFRSSQIIPRFAKKDYVVEISQYLYFHYNIVRISEDLKELQEEKSRLSANTIVSSVYI